MKTERVEMTQAVDFRFYAELNDFLLPAQRQRTFSQPYKGRVTVKHLVESLGVPHGEIDLILANGRSVDFSYIVQAGDRLSVYPIFESIDIGPVGRLRPLPLRESRFVADTHLGQLATYLRLAGFDTLYRRDYEDETLAQIASDEQRILLTRDRGLLKRKLVTHGYCVRESDPEQQFASVIRRFDLAGSMRPFRRCLRCNGLLAAVAKETIHHRLPPNTQRYYDDFSVCTGCDQVYWPGSHYQRMRRFLARVLDQAREPGP